jgi:hypothetical protein
MRLWLGNGWGGLAGCESGSLLKLRHQKSELLSAFAPTKTERQDALYGCRHHHTAGAGRKKLTMFMVLRLPCSSARDPWGVKRFFKPFT